MGAFALYVLFMLTDVIVAFKKTRSDNNRFHNKLLSKLWNVSPTPSLAAMGEASGEQDVDQGKRLDSMLLPHLVVNYSWLSLDLGKL